MSASTGRAGGRLIIVSGLPGAGKTALARQLEVDCPGIRLCADDWMAELGIDLYDQEARQRVERLQWQLAERALAVGATAIVEWGTWARSERDALRLRARELGAAVELRFLDAPLQVLWSRVRDRDVERRSVDRQLTLADMERYEALLQRPDAEELGLFDPPCSRT